MKENQFCKPIIDVAAKKCILEFKEFPTLVLDIAKVHPGIIERAAYVGLTNVKIADVMAIPRADSEGNVRNVVEHNRLKYQRAKDEIARLESGAESWSSRVAAAPKIDRSELVREALGRLGVKAEVLAGFDKDKLASLSKAQKCKEMMLKIEAERIKPALDADSELSALMGQ